MPIERMLTLWTGLLLLLALSSQTIARPAEEILTNDSIIQLLKVGFDEDTIIAKIQKTKHSFDLSVQGMVALKAGNVSDRLHYRCA